MGATANLSVTALQVRLAALIVIGIPMAIISIVVLTMNAFLPNAPVTGGIVFGSYMLSTADNSTVRTWIHNPNATAGRESILGQRNLAGIDTSLYANGEDAIFDQLQNTWTATTFIVNILIYIQANIQNFWVVILHVMYFMLQDLVGLFGSIMVENILLQCLLIHALQLGVLLLDTVLRMADRLMRVLGIVWRGSADIRNTEYATPTSEFFKYPIEVILKASGFARLLIRILSILLEEFTPPLASIVRSLVVPLLKAIAALFRLIRSVISRFVASGLMHDVMDSMVSTGNDIAGVSSAACQLGALIMNTACQTVDDGVRVANVLNRVYLGLQGIYDVVMHNYFADDTLNLPGMGPLASPVSVRTRRPDGFFATEDPTEIFHAKPTMNGMHASQTLGQRMAARLRALNPGVAIDPLERIVLGEWPSFVAQLCQLRQMLPNPYADVQEEHSAWRMASFQDTNTTRSPRLVEAHTAICAPPYRNDGAAQKDLVNAAMGMADRNRWAALNGRMTDFWDDLEDAFVDPWQELMDSIYGGYPDYLRAFGDRMQAGFYATAQFVASGLTFFLGDYWNAVETIKRMLRGQIVDPYVSELTNYIQRLYGPLQLDIAFVQDIWPYLEQAVWNGQTYTGQLVEFIYYDGIHALIQQKLTTAALSDPLVTFPPGQGETGMGCAARFNLDTACGSSIGGVLNPTSVGAMALIQSRINYYKSTYEALTTTSGRVQTLKDDLVAAIDPTDLATLANLLTNLIANPDFVVGITELANSATRAATQIASEMETYAADGQVPDNYDVSSELCPVSCMFTPRDPSCYQNPACGVQGYWPNGTLPESNMTRFASSSTSTSSQRTGLGREFRLRDSEASRAERAMIGQNMYAARLHLNFGALATATKKFLSHLGDTSGYDLKDPHDAVFWPQPIPNWYHALDLNDPSGGAAENNGTVVCADPRKPFATCTSIFDTYSCCRCLIMCRPITRKPGDRMLRTSQHEYLASLDCSSFKGIGQHTLRMLRRWTDGPVRALLGEVESSPPNYALVGAFTDWMVEDNEMVRNMTTKEFVTCATWESWWTTYPLLLAVAAIIVFMAFYVLFMKIWRTWSLLHAGYEIQRLNKLHTWALLVDHDK